MICLDFIKREKETHKHTVCARERPEEMIFFFEFFSLSLFFLSFENQIISLHFLVLVVVVSHEEE